MKKVIVAVTLALTAALSVSAAGPTLDVRLEPERVGVEDAARLIVKITEPPSDLSQPELGELVNVKVVAGPSRGTEFSFINGVATSAVSFSYVLRAEQVGPASVGPVTVAAGETLLRSEPIRFEVVPGSAMPPRRSRRISPFPSDPFADIFGRRSVQQPTVALRHLVSPREVVLGQPVMATVVLDTTSAVEDFSWTTAPSYPGWWAQRVEPPEQITPEPVEVDGVRFSRFTIARHALVPLKSGTVTLPQLEARILTRSRSLLDPGQMLERSTPQIAVEVADRPAAPPGFAGAVGQLRYSARLEPDAIAFGESTVLTVRLEGSGNLPLVETPGRWPSCAACESYPPEEDSRVKVDSAGIHGSRSWRTTIVPREWGELRLEPVTLAVFDPRTESYRQHTLGPLLLTVAAPPPSPTPTSPPVGAVSLPAEDAGEGRPSQVAPAPLERWIWLLAALLLGVVFGGLTVWIVVRRRSAVIPARTPGQNPADRARELQVALERWWLDARGRAPSEAVREEMETLRKDLEAVRFAPGRADHTDTIAELEERFRGLLRRA